VDNDCDGVDGVDADGDGHARVASGGGDCDDSDGEVNPGRPDFVDGFCFRTSRSWTLSDITEPLGASAGSFDLAIDVDGHSHVSYYTRAGTLGYATNASGAWVLYVVDATASTGAASSLAVGQNGVVHIAYSARQARELRYASGGPDGWAVAVLDSGGAINSRGQYLSPAMDATDGIHILYRDGLAQRLRYIVQRAGGWGAPEVVPGVDEPNTGVSLALDGSDLAHGVACGNPALRCVTKASGGWSSSYIEGIGGGCSQHHALAVCRDGTVRIAWSANTRTGQFLYVVERVAEAWSGRRSTPV